MQKRTKQHSLEHWGMLFSLWKETSNFKVNLFDSMGPLSTLSQPISICRLPTNWLSWRFVVWMLFECWDMYRINISIMLHWLVGEYSSSISKSERGRNRQLWSQGRLWSNESFMQIAAEVMPFFSPQCSPNPAERSAQWAQKSVRAKTCLPGLGCGTENDVTSHRSLWFIFYCIYFTNTITLAQGELSNALWYFLFLFLILGIKLQTSSERRKGGRGVWIKKYFSHWV